MRNKGNDLSTDVMLGIIVNGTCISFRTYRVRSLVHDFIIISQNINGTQNWVSQQNHKDNFVRQAHVKKFKLNSSNT